ncbi:unnamed protein product [Microthlaspi erraticum]|uniref:NYN domain-containing protein n=1 Tax=Microthlaspi erraticum TaxID=1685480 RepID=A0A6D2IH61_9BRAS|nr:unnamed protein product [Microthlaspi erraticum]
MSSLTTSYAEAKTCVFWDVEDCPIPDGQDPESVAINIKSALAKNGYRGEVTIRAYGEKYQVQDFYESAGIKLFPQGDNYARYMKMHMAVYDWMGENGLELTNLMMVSGDNSGFRRTVGMRNHNILLAQPQNSPRRCSDCTSPLPAIVSAEWIWESLSAGGDPITTTPTTSY